jgi:hypothetical protein
MRSGSATGAALERAERALESIEDDVLAGLNAKERATLRRLLVQALEGVSGSVREPTVASTRRHRPASRT